MRKQTAKTDEGLIVAVRGNGFYVERTRAKTQPADAR
jgi:hypothetical protein